MTAPNLDPETERALRDAATNGVAAEAVMHAVTTAIAVMNWADFGEWRAWADSQGLTSGPRTEEVFAAHRKVLAMVGMSLADIPQPASPAARDCPECGGRQEWCEKPGCILNVMLGGGHWSHLTEDTDCRNLGDTNTDPSQPPDNVHTRGLL